MSRVCALPTITDDSALGGAVIERSFRFNDDDNSYLFRTPSSAGNRKTWTLSVWVKRTTIDANQRIFTAYDGSNINAECNIQFQSDGKIQINNNNTSSNTDTNLKTDRVFRDPSSWYHIVIGTDMTQGTASDRVNLYINGVQETSFSTESYGTQNVDWWFNNNSLQTIGRRHNTTERPFDGYMAEFNFIDGQQLTPSYFGFTESQTNIWMPKRYGGTYGTNGFRLDFSDNSSITNMVKDKSGNGNHFSPDNCNTEDSMLDTPSNTFATLNPLSTSVNTLSQGNLYSTGGGASWRPVSSDMAMSSGRWYWEVYIDTVSSYQIHGIRPQIRDDGDVNHDNDYYPGTRADEWGYDGRGYLHNSASPDTSWGDSYAAGDILGFALDMDAGTLNIYKNGSSTGSQITGISASHSPSGSRGDYLVCLCVYGSTGQAIINFGQEGTFAGHKTAQNNTDINGIGNFYYTPPTGFKALCSANLRGDSSYIIEPQKHFDVLTYSGTGSSNSITDLEFSPDLIWAKRRNTSGHHHLWIDTIRGGDKSLSSNLQASDNTNANRDMTFLANGIRWNSDTGNANASGGTYVAWCWKGGGSSNTYNIDGTGYGTASAAGLDGGTITPTGASVNTEAGFSIITYTGNGTTGSTVAHGLGKKPAWVVIKCRSHTDNWMVYHQGNNNFSSPEDFYLEMNANGGDIDSVIMMNDTAPTTSVFSLQDDHSVNGNTKTYVAWCWAEIPGYSKFGTYRGNSSSSNGSYIHLGFRPALIIIKKFSGSDSWQMHYSAVSTYNPKVAALYPSSDDAETTSGRIVDLLSNGFKHYNADGNSNEDGHDYVYMAFAERAGQTAYGTFPNAR